MKASVIIQMISFFLLIPSEMYAVNPIDFGLKTAKNGEERFWAIYNAHMSAVNTGDGVTYSGAGDLEIEIPVDAKTVPISWNTDFCGITITVKNSGKDFTLFSYSGEKKSIEIAKKDLDGNSFSMYGPLKEGAKVLIIKDETPWIENRIGFSYGAKRSDVRLLINGRAQNDAIMPYNNIQTNPTVLYFDSNKKRKEIGNLKFVRTEDSKFITRLFDIEAVNNVFIHDVAITTPQSNELFGDAIISVSNATNVSIKNITIDGTYSSKDKYGYGISLGNLWNVKCSNIIADAEWGVFCCNNINKSHISNCELNRFDCHCYGRDITADGCIFHDLSNQISSVYGTVCFKNCVFRDFIPIYIRDDYNSYTPFDVKFSNCTVYVTEKAHTLIYMGGAYLNNHRRPELASNCWPNIEIRDLRVVCEEGVENVSLFDVNHNIPKDFTVEHISRIDARRINISSNKIVFAISTKPVKTDKQLYYVFKQRGSSAQIITRLGKR